MALCHMLHKKYLIRMHSLMSKKLGNSVSRTATSKLSFLLYLVKSSDRFLGWFEKIVNF